MGNRSKAATLSADRTRQAYVELRELIVHGRLAPGSRVIETEIADRLGFSRTPIRGALQRLQQEGYIVNAGSGRHSRPAVAPLTQEDARELLYIVGEVEGLAARWSASLDKAPREKLIAELTRINNRMLSEANKKSPSRSRVFELDTEFHRAYVAAGAGPRLLGLHDAIKPQAERYTRLYIEALIDQIGVSVSEHQAIVDAIASGSPTRAHRAVQANWRNAAKRLAGVIERAGELGSW